MNDEERLETIIPDRLPRY